jgi:hypothetical protein
VAVGIHLPVLFQAALPGALGYCFVLPPLATDEKGVLYAL